MYKIEGRNIYITRGDACVISIKSSELNELGEKVSHIFKQGDILSLGIYKENGYSKGPMFYKEITLDEDSEIVDFILTSEDTKFGKYINKPKNYWYEIQYNKDQTILGYDESGPKLFVLYPEGDDSSE